MTAEELKDFRKLAYTIRYWEEQLREEKKKTIQNGVTFLIAKYQMMDNGYS